jgi:hypothetical protein
VNVLSIHADDADDADDAGDAGDADDARHSLQHLHSYTINRRELMARKKRKRTARKKETQRVARKKGPKEGVRMMMKRRKELAHKGAKGNLESL